MSSTTLLDVPEVAESEVVLTVTDRSGEKLLKAAVRGDKPTSELTRELAELSGQPPGEYAMYSGDGTRLLDPGTTVSDNLETGEATVRLVRGLTGN